MDDPSDILIVLSGAPLGTVGRLLLEGSAGDPRIQQVEQRALDRLERLEKPPALLLIQGGAEPPAFSHLLWTCFALWPSVQMVLFDEDEGAPGGLKTFFEQGGQTVLTEAMLAPDVWPDFINVQVRNQAQSLALAEYEVDQTQGAATQRRMMPGASLTTPYCRLSHQTKPCLTLSGDFIDYQVIDADRVLFCLADVSGHGSSSALVTVVLQEFLRGSLAGVTPADAVEPSELIQGLNQAICESAFDHYVTCVVGVIDGSTGLLSYVSAGHFPHPMLIQKGEISLLESSNLPLGLLNSSGYDAHQLTLVPDFRLVIVTDGVLEGLVNKTLVEREAQLLSFVEKDAGEADGWLSRFIGDSDERLADDASVLCIAGLRSR